MVFEDYLQSYLDGTLSDAGQEEFFHIISVSPEKRAAYNQYGALRASMRSDRVAEVVPVALEESILAASAVKVPTSMMAARISSFVAGGVLRTVLPYAVAAGFVSSGVIGYFVGNVAATKPDAPAHVALSSPAVSSPSAPVTAGPTASSANAIESHRHIGSTTRFHSSSPIRTAASPSVDAGTVASPNHGTVAAVGVVDESPRVTRLTFADNAPLAYPMPIIVRAAETSEFPRPTIIDDGGLRPAPSPSLRFQAQIQQGGAALLPSISSSTLNNAPTLNVQVARVGVKTSENSALGFTAGQSTFALKYSTQPSQLKSVTFLQYSTLGFGAAYFEQVFPSLSVGRAVPHALVELGGTSFGPLVNGQLGLSYPLSGSVNADVSAMVSSLFFMHDASWFSSQKLGVMVGIRTEF